MEMAKILVGCLLCVCFLVLSNCESATLLMTRLGLMPYSAWSKKKGFNVESGRQSVATERITPSDGHSFAETAIRGCIWRGSESI